VADGSERWRTFTNEKDAEQFLVKVKSERFAGLLVDPRGGERLFGPYAERWLETRLVRGRPLTPMTRQGYRGLLRRHIEPTFAKARLRQITPETVREWYSTIVDKAGNDAAAKSYRLLRAIMTTAVSDDLVGRNPCRIRGAGTEHADERPMLEARTVLMLADAIDERYRALVLLAGFGGLRTGELLGLERRDVDVLHRRVHVRRQSQEIHGEGRVTMPPKSDAGLRDVALPPSILAALDEHLARFIGEELDAPVFTGPGGAPLRRATLSAAWKRACVAVGLTGLRVHDLRHHAATQVARRPGVTTKELMAQIGHSTPVAALRYQHATEERGREIADHLEQVIAEAKTPQAEAQTGSVVQLPAR
jgi:integrase